MIERTVSLTSNAARLPDPNRNMNNTGRLPWDDLRLFLAVAEAGSFRSAAVLAGVSINTIRSKVERLERQIGGALLRRSVEGVALTQDGREILQIAREMRALGRTTARVARAAAGAGAAVRVAVDSVGTAWLVPQLALHQARNPGVRLSLDCESRASDVLFRDIDLSIQIEKPGDPMLGVERVATLHFMLFASAAYVAAHGLPQSEGEAVDHRLVRQTNDCLDDVLIGSAFDGGQRQKHVSFETNTSAAHYWAIGNGAGIGFLPTYAALLDPQLIPVDIDIVIQRDVYLVSHADAHAKAGIDTARQWLSEAFDAALFPCFDRTFVHPGTFSHADVTPIFGRRQHR